MPKKKGVVKILEFPRKTAQFEDDFGFYGIKFYVADIEVIRLLLFCLPEVVYLTPRTTSPKPPNTQPPNLYRRPIAVYCTTNLKCVSTGF